MIEFSYERVSDKQCTITFVKNEQDAIGWIEWSEGGGVITDDAHGALSLWAMIGLYEIARGYNGHAPIEAVEYIRTHQMPEGRARFRAVPAQKHYPSASDIVAGLVDASAYWVKTCCVEEVEVDGAQGQQLFVTVCDAQLLNMMDDSKPVEVAYSGGMLDWVNTSFIPHRAARDPMELFLLPNLCKPFKRRQPFKGDSEEDRSPEEQVIFTPDGQFLIAMSVAGEVVAFEMTTFKEQWRYHTGMLFPHAHISPSSDLLSVRSYGQTTVFEIDPRDGSFLNEYEVSYPPESTVSPLGQWLVTPDEYPQSSIELSSLHDAYAEPFVIRQPGPVECLAFSPDETLLLVGGYYDHVTLWDLNTRRLLNTFDVGSERTFDMSFSADGRHFSLKTYQLKSRRNMSVITIHRVGCGTIVNRFMDEGYTYAPRWSPAGPWVAMTSDSYVHMYRLNR